MEKEKLSVAKVVRSLILSRPIIRECMLLDVINYSATARLIAKELEDSGSTISMDAIKMSLLRLREDLRKERTLLEKKIQRIIASTVIELQSDLAVITVEKSALFRDFKNFSRIMERSRFFQLTQGLETFTVVISSEEKDEMINLWKGYIVDVIENQTAIVLISPKEIIETPGVVTFISSALSFNGINVTQIISCYKETVFVVDRENAPRAYQIIEKTILQMRARN